jgi:hypothetical protein
VIVNNEDFGLSDRSTEQATSPVNSLFTPARQPLDEVKKCVFINGVNGKNILKRAQDKDIPFQKKCYLIQNTDSAENVLNAAKSKMSLLSNPMRQIKFRGS